MAAIDQPSENALTIREAAAACRLSPRTLRRKLNEGAFPSAYKTEPTDQEPEGVWMIPAAELERAGLRPTLLHPTLTDSTRARPDPTPTGDGPTVLELVRSDRFGRLRAELAEAVAAAEIALLRAEAERWRVIADERATALDRADTALKALTTAMNSESFRGGNVPVTAGAAGVDASGDIVAVPPLVRAEAMRYTATLQALHDLRRQQNRWWQFWR